MKKKANPSRLKVSMANVEEVTVASTPLYNPTPTKTKIKANAFGSSRRNAAGDIERSDKFANIESGISPFGSEGSTITVKEAITLCQKAYYNFPIFRNTIEMMVEFSVNNIYFKGGNAKSIAFFDAWLKKIGINGVQDNFYREYYRSGNVFLLRHDAQMRSEDISDIVKTYGGYSKAAKTLIPIKYSILNPASIEFLGSLAFNNPKYLRVLNDYEVALLKDARTKEDVQFLESLPKDVQKMIKSGAARVTIPVDPEQIYAVFYKKQDYEPFAVPMGYGVLSDLNWKEELKKMDMALTRVIQQVVLLITTGAEPDKGGINPKNIEALNQIFENESIGRVLVADYTTKGEFIIPQVGDILDPKKYQIVNEDIQLGLHSILVSNEKFANQSLKIQLFVEKLKQARQNFLDSFLIPEIKRLSDELGFKNYPTPYFQEFDLKDEVEFARIYSRLAELGILTPEETIKAIETGILPDPESSEISQKKFKEFHKDELYFPISVLGQQDPINGTAGRPGGTKAPQSTKKISPIGASFSISKLQTILKEASSFQSVLEEEYKQANNIKTIDKDDEINLHNLSLSVMANEPMKEWKSKAKLYVESPVDINEAAKKNISSLSEAYQLNSYESLLLHLSQE